MFKPLFHVKHAAPSRALTAFLVDRFDSMGVPPAVGCSIRRRIRSNLSCEPSGFWIKPFGARVAEPGHRRSGVERATQPLSGPARST